MTTMETTRVSMLAQAVYDGLCAEGLEECFYGTPFRELPEATQARYLRIAKRVEAIGKAKAMTEEKP